MYFNVDNRNRVPVIVTTIEIMYLLNNGGTDRRTQCRYELF